MNDLILCVLHRATTPLSAGDVCDQAVALAMAADWPRRAWGELTPQRVAALLKGMESRQEVRRAGKRKENGTVRPLWTVPGVGDANWPLPDPPAPGGEDHPLVGMTRRQQFALFDVLDTTLGLMFRQRRELDELVARHHRDLAEHTAAVKRDLLAAGIEGATR